MTASGPKSLPAMGFLTVIVDPEQGLFGGYLVLNAAGRPLEFHCTAPVRPNRAQEILYGNTLESFLFGEHIGRALLNKAKRKPEVVWTDVAPALTVRAFTESPVALVQAMDGAPPPENAPEPLAPAVQLGQYSLRVAAAHAGDAEALRAFWQHAESFDLLEPFERIREAIAEARRGGKRAAA